jgi:RNA polymerase sigma-70 factor, ECF subfamily
VAESAEVLERVFRAESGVVMAALAAQLRDLDLAEDALQDAIASALERWPSDGVPRKPGAWLLVAARRKALDRLRRRATRLDKESAVRVEAELDGAPELAEDAQDIPDERLRLIFTCCHPALGRRAQVASSGRSPRWAGGSCARRRSGSSTPVPDGFLAQLAYPLRRAFRA